MINTSGNIRTNMKHNTLDVDELARQNPILTEEDLEDCYTFEEAVQECIRQYDEGVKQINKEYAAIFNKGKTHEEE